MKKTIIWAIIIIIIILVGAYFFISNLGTDTDVDLSDDEDVTDVEDEEEPRDEDRGDEDKSRASTKVIGQSVEGREIVVRRFGEGEDKILFVGGIHGGYSWNTSLLAYELIDYLENNEDEIPENIEVSVVPVLNPDGLAQIVDTVDASFTANDVSASLETRTEARFNANNVDLNRNFDCQWQESGTWRNATVSGGDEPFSEPESRAIKNYIESENPEAVVVFYSSAGGVFASNCGEGILPETQELTDLYADASGYQAYQEFDFYEITGDMVNWLAKNEVPAISVLLTNHEDIEWSKNRQGVEALLEYYAR